MTDNFWILEAPLDFARGLNPILKIKKYRGVINGKADKAAALPTFSDKLNLG